MNEPTTAMATIYSGWHTHQTRLAAALSPLSAEQLILHATPTLRSIGEIATHMIGARARWFRLDKDDHTFVEFAIWDRPGLPVRTAVELAYGLETTWQGMQAAIAGWTPDDWQQTFPGKPPAFPAVITRMWMLWHLIEHDLHHGGEIALILSMHGLAAPDI